MSFYSVIPTQLEFLGSTKLANNAASSTNITVPAREQLFIMINIVGYGGGGDVASLRFNADSGNNYWDRHLTSATGATTFSNTQNVSTSLIRVAGNSSTQSRRVTAYITNISTITKSVVFDVQTATNAAGTAGTLDIGGGEWVNTANAITQIQLITAGGQNMLAGTEFTVWGFNPT